MDDFHSKFGFREKVIIDGDVSICGVVTGFQCRETREMLVAISYVHNGMSYENWFEEWRLELAQ